MESFKDHFQRNVRALARGLDENWTVVCQSGMVKLVRRNANGLYSAKILPF